MWQFVLFCVGLRWNFFALAIWFFGHSARPVTGMIGDGFCRRGCVLAIAIKAPRWSFWFRLCWFYRPCRWWRRVQIVSLSYSGRLVMFSLLLLRLCFDDRLYLLEYNYSAMSAIRRVIARSRPYGYSRK